MKQIRDRRGSSTGATTTIQKTSNAGLIWMLWSSENTRQGTCARNVYETAAAALKCLGAYN
jgi:hypothetical protein